jgi:hypothetical protein
MTPVLKQRPTRPPRERYRSLPKQLIEQAKATIRDWSSDEPRDLVIAVASLCREILDVGNLPEGDHDWQRLRQSFDLKRGQSIASTIADWDDQCRARPLSWRRGTWPDR